MACSGGVAAPPDGGAAGVGGGASASTTSTSSAATGGCDNGVICAKCVECAKLGPCSSQSDTCDDNPECIAMSACVDGCGMNDLPCTALCNEAHPDGVTDWKALSGCEASACPMSCGAGGG
jgi:hypothetical protein